TGSQARARLGVLDWRATKMKWKTSLTAGLGVLLAALLMAWGLHQVDRATAQERPGAGKAQRGASPILSGKLVSVKIWQYPIGGSGNNSAQTCTKGRVAVYETFIVVTDPEGIRSLYPNGYWSDLQFRSE